ncbi:unnamed protein product, partial [Porites lobata]
LTESCTVNLSATHFLKIESADISHVQDDLQKFWDLETLGIRDTETSVHDKFSNEIRFTGERYQQLESGVVEEVRQDQVLEPGNVHYLPHRGVVRLDRDTT